MKSATEKEQALTKLRLMLKPGDTVWTVLKHRASSGMYRVLDLYVIRDNEPLRLTWSAADAMGRKYDNRHEGLAAGGCGMDMGFEAVHALSRALWPDGYTCTGPGCYSNDHTNGDQDYSPHQHQDGGYALKQRWL